MDKSGTYRRFGIPRSLLRAAGVSVLILHVLLTAFAPQELLLLAGHDHMTQGTLTREEWQAHLRFHLQQARTLLDGAHTTADNHHTGDSRIISVTADDIGVHNTAPPALALLPSGRALMGFTPGRGEAITCLCALDLSPALDVPHLPPTLRPALPFLE